MAPSTTSAALRDPAALQRRAQELLTQLAGPDARLRPEQLQALVAVVGERGRALVVQRTGFGKSAIYFIATRVLRDAGAGPTLVVSPLLALMREQVAAAERMGVRSATINSTNADEWTAVRAAVEAGELDLLCISPERLNNASFVHGVLPRLAAGLGLLVIDEAHCISDWGHDFRPDYRRIRDTLAGLAPGTPVLATTATANQRVCADVAEQLGDRVTVLRGTLDRASLHLGVATLPSLAHRLAWLTRALRDAAGTGIVYCLTVAQTEQVAGFLRGQGLEVRAYSSALGAEERLHLEADFRANRCKALVATSALGMGVDKPDVSFVYHLGAPPSPIAYYQQVGRAGRSLPRAEAWLLPGEEDRAIWSWSSSVGLPSEEVCTRVLDALAAGNRARPTSVVDLERQVDLRRGRLDTLLKILDVDGAVERVGRGWVRTDRPWRYDTERVARIDAARRREADAMVRYAQGSRCLMAQLRASLDDAGAEPCGRCSVCTSAPDPVEIDPALVREAAGFLRGVEVPIDPRKQWARGLDEPRGRLPAERRAETGRALCRVDDAGWWPVVRDALGSGQVGDDLLAGLSDLVGRWDPRATWVTWVPSSTRDPFLAELATRLGRALGLPVRQALSRQRRSPPQTSCHNSAHRLANVWGAFALTAAHLPAPSRSVQAALVLDDRYDSGWTMTVVASQLREAGVDVVLPLALART